MKLIFLIDFSHQQVTIKFYLQVNEVLAKAPKELIGKPLFTGFLSATQWQTLGAIQAELQNEYRIRRQMLIKRLDVTIQSFQVIAD
jgi:hypothetical protein